MTSVVPQRASGNIFTFGVSLRNLLMDTVKRTTVKVFVWALESVQGLDLQED